MAAAILAYASLHTISEKPSASPAADDARTPADLKSASSGAGAYADIGLHPLFEPSRQPWSPPKVIAVTSAVPAAVLPIPRGYVLVGLVMTAGQHAALVRDAGGKTRILAEGQTLDGWSVHNIDAAGVHLRTGSENFDLTMTKQRR